MGDLPFAQAGDDVIVSVRLTPRAPANRIQGTHADADGTIVLKVQVTAPPESGKANAALIKVLAKAWKLPKTSLSIVSGATSRRKVVRIGGDARTILDRLHDWVNTL